MTDQAKQPEQKHTPLPWKRGQWTEQLHVRNGIETTIEDSRGHALFTACHKGYSAKAEANADFVELACNNHDQMLDALRGVLKVCRRATAPHAPMPPWIQKVIDAIVATTA